MNGSSLPAVPQWLQENPLFVAGAAFIFLVMVLRGSRRFIGRGGRGDTQRLFTQAQKAEAGRRCGDSRCEHKHPFWFRCSARGTHGDHIYPHSKGGMTAMSNLQLLCPTHNLRKGASVPSPLYIWRLERRRVLYFPKGVSGRVEWRDGRAS